MNDGCVPQMSVVMITPDRYDTLRKTVQYLQAQTAREQLEIVIVAPSATALGLDDSELKEFCRYLVVEAGEIRSVARAWAAGIRQATAPVVIYAEDHCYPEPCWAEALIEAHRGPWGAVGPVMGNANPWSRISWANFFIAYGRWAEPAVAGETDDVPAHNSAYKRAPLLDYGPDLEGMLEVESLLHRDLRARGYRLYWEPAAKTSHVNFTLLSPLVRAEFHYGRLFASARAQRWSLLARWLYALCGPVIPLVRVRRVIRQIYRTGQQRALLPGILPALLVGLISAALGEMLGYISGVGAAPVGKCDLEFHRHRYLREQDGQG
jgi:glycosyltransferase involved in cell wall biosynthesis